MNELMKKLIKQSGCDYPEFPMEEGYEYPELLEFAELIVRECADWMADMQYDDGTAVKSLLEHFGIEDTEGCCGGCNGQCPCQEEKENTDTQNSR